MGETSSCCHPTTQLSEIQNISLPDNIVQANQKFNPVDMFVEPSPDIIQTLKKAEQYTREKTLFAGIEQSPLWAIKVKTGDKNSFLYCRGGVKGKELKGNVILYFPNGEIFKGTVLSNRPTYGIYIFRKGTYYAGNMKGLNAQNQGKFQNIDVGYIYEGGWSKSLPHGHGKQVYRNGDRYQGQLMYGAKFGHGVYSFSDGKIYEGSFYFNQSDGKGKMKYPNNSSYEGDWKLGLYHGLGKYTWNNNEFYQGQYFEGLRNGQGKYKFKNGSIYEGYWKNGYQHGRGTLKEAFDEIVGEWDQGQLIS